MATSLQSIPPLVPVPSEGRAIPNDKDKEDIFSTLFSPATPHASPVLDPVPDVAPRRPHVRSSSNASDFGSFVSVPASEDPLAGASFSENFAPLTPLNAEFFDKFGEEARAATEKNQQGFLAELLEHEDDPMYWHKYASSGGTTPMRAVSPRPISAASMFNEINESAMQDIKELALDPLDDPPPEPSTSRHRALSITTPAPHPADRSRHSPIARSPSLPPEPAHATPPVLTRTQSHTTFATSSIPTRWMSSFLAARAAPTPPPPPPPPPSHTPHPPPTHFATLPAGMGAGITHGSPFAAQPFVPATGAPGFAGDRDWNKAGFVFDEGRVEKKSLKLVGRKEVTTPVLSVALADEIRPHLPALARLPKSWTLLYSLDQHGISLHTLYTRCEAHTGGAVVVIRDSNDAVFGAWMGEGVHPSKGAYFGSGESFLWKMNDKLRVYKWTGKNEYVALCEPEYISFGGGDGHYGLYLDDTLLDGSSARCPTFDNEPLCSPGPKKGGTVTFECVGLEVWGVGGL